MNVRSLASRFGRGYLSPLLRARRVAVTACVAALLAVHAIPEAAAQGSDAHYAAGVSAFNAGDYGKAITEMRASLAAAPSANAALYLGNAHLKLGQLDAARAALARVLQIEPNSPKRAAILDLIKGIDAARRGTVNVTSTPPGATIYLESVSPANGRGTTPKALVLTPGRHAIILKLEGYDEARQTAEVKPKDKLELTFDLAAKGCPLELSAEPVGAKASVDGAEPAALPAKVKIGVGEHRVSFTADKFVTKEVPVTCTAGRPLVADAKLEPVPGRVKVGAAVGVSVTVDGRTLTPTELTEGVVLSPGTHEVVFTGGGRPTTTRTIEVAAAAEIAVEPPPLSEQTPPPPPPQPTPAPPPPTPSTSFPALGLYVGAIAGANLTLVEWNLGTDTRGAYPKSSAMGGLRVGLQILPRLAVEGEVHWVGLPNRLDDGLGHGLATNVNGLFHILATRWTPVVEAGGGTYQVLSSALGADADLRLHAGVGLRGRLGETLALRLDVRDVITDGFDKSIGNNLEVLVGVDAFFWKKK